ncbi:transposase [Cellulosilyticum ruminicola]
MANYHQCRFTNVAVEGKNNKIKALQRRSYFLRNRQS